MNDTTPTFVGYDDCNLVEITDQHEAKKMLVIKTSCCWSAGRKMDEAGVYVELCSPSPQRDIKRTVFYCRNTLLPQTYAMYLDTMMAYRFIPTDRASWEWRQKEIHGFVRKD